ncbi:MAG: hypothetical protein IJ246_01370 [Clostridia bacterium]|nr:hypothetical protein [Clostridia bacterium]
MKKLFCLLLAIGAVLALAVCGALSEAEEWTRQGAFEDAYGNHLLVQLSETEGYEGWAVSFILDEEPIGWIIQQEGNTLYGNLRGWDENEEPFIVTVSEEGEDGLKLEVEGGETYHFSAMDLPEASIVVTANTEGWGYIAYTEGETAPEFDPEYPAQSVYIGLAEPAVHTFAAQPQAGNLFVKWTRNGEDFSTDPQITLLLDESAEYIAVFAEDPDWQNPVMNFVGDYQCDRAHAQVSCFASDEAWITIDWGSSAWELTRWIIVGRLDTETMTITYEGAGKTNLVYDADGEVKSEEQVYVDGTGTIAFHDDGTFTWHEDQSESGNDMVFAWIEPAFAYIHDPRENAEAMADIIENPEAVYGFSPNPDSQRLGTFAAYDWTDPAFVAQAQEERRAYHESMDTMTDMLFRMREDGASMEAMARAVSEERNRLRLAACADNPESLAAVKESNLKTYGHEEGPLPDELFEKYGSWTAVLQKAFSTNMGMDACCGLYDEYYWLYIELGYVEE